ncbi:MAG: hypothetical protein ABIT37_09915 [Luteolibacter sp.]
MPEQYDKSRYLEIHSRAGRLRCRVVEAPSDVADAFDSGRIVEELWANHSLEVTNRFRRTFPSGTLEACELPREVMENHLLVEIYRPYAFPVLLAERLVSLLPPGPARTLVSLPACAGDPYRLAGIIESRLRKCPTSRGGIRSFFSRCGATAGFVAGAAYALFGVLTLGLASRKNGQSLRPTLSKNLFVVYSGVSNHTRHIWNEIDRIPEGNSHPMVLVLGHKPLEEDLLSRVKDKGGEVIYPLHAGDILPSLVSLALCWRQFLRLQRRGEKDLEIHLGTGFHVRSGAWLMRGLLHDCFLRREAMDDPGNTVAIFGLIAHADSRLADLALRARGGRTIHWLHGTVEDSLHYRANSSICLCKNEVDSELRQRHGSYNHYAVHPDKLPAGCVSDNSSSSETFESSGLVITNLIHPDSRFSDFGASWALAELLRMTSRCFKDMGLRTMTWRPHPRESAVPEFSTFNRLALDLGFSVDNTTPLDQQVRSNRHVVTSFSGSIGDVAASGGVPAIFAGLPYEPEGHWGQLSDRLKFRTADELTKVLRSIEDEQWAAQQRLNLLRQYNQHPGGFAATESLLSLLRSENCSPLIPPAV